MNAVTEKNSCSGNKLYQNVLHAINFTKMAINFSYQNGNKLYQNGNKLYQNGNKLDQNVLHALDSLN